MYLHLGKETLVNTRDVVGLFDLDTSSLSKKTREFLATAEKAGRGVNVSSELPKSVVLARDGRLYISQLSTATLKKRLEAQKQQRSGGKILDNLL